MAGNTRLVTVTACGVSAKADPEGLDDYDLVLAIGEYGYTSAKSFEAIGCALFGEEGWEEAKESLRDENGKLRLTKVGEFIDSATEQIDALKN